MLEEVYGKEAMNKTQVSDWHKHYCDCCAIVNDDPCCEFLDS
jgi:hypothetical protein